MTNRQYKLTLTFHKMITSRMKTCMHLLCTLLPGPLGSHSPKFPLLRFNNSNLSKLGQCPRNSKRWNPQEMTATLAKINQMKVVNILRHRSHQHNLILFCIMGIKQDNDG